MQSIEPLRLQRLIDGELGLDETQELLRTAESQPGLWRELATTFVENRMWQNNIVEMNDSADSIVGSPNTASPLETNSHWNAVNPKPPGSNRRTSVRWWLSLAASMLLALSIGFAAGQWRDDVGSGPDIAMQDSADTHAADKTPGLTHAVYRPDYRMQFEDTKGNPLTDSDIPLYYSHRAEEFGLTLKPRVIPDEVLRMIRNSGYKMKQDLQYVSGTMSDGRQFVVPIRRIELVPGQ